MDAESRPQRTFVAPADLAGRGVTLRDQTPDDLPFLRRLYVSQRWEEVQRIPHWDDAMRLAFLEDQQARQHHHYTTYYTRSDFLIVMFEGEPIGRLALDRGHASDLRIVDIAFLPDARGRGYGAALLAAVQDEARADGKDVSVHVEQDNPAKRFYERLGFREVGQNGPYRLMSWSRTASAAEQTASVS